MIPTLIFSLLIAFTTASITAAGVVGIKTGELDRTIIKPIKQQVEVVKKALTLTPNPDVGPLPSFSPEPPKVASSSAKPSVKPTVKPKPVVKPKTQVITQPKTTTTNADQAYQDALKAQQQWAADQQAKNDAWFKEQSAKNAASSQQWYQEQTAKAAAEQEAWKKAHGF